MESDPRLKEHDYSCPLPASGRSDTMDDLFLNSFVPLQNDVSAIAAVRTFIYEGWKLQLTIVSLKIVEY